MNLPLYIAKRYFLAKKKTNVINLISAVALMGITFGTAALIVVLSVFNGFEDLAKSMLNAFNPDIKILPAKGKFFSADSVTDILKNDKDVAYYSRVLEENALIEYDEKQYIGIVKGVDSSFRYVTGIDTMMIYGEYKLTDAKRGYAVVGSEIAYTLGVQLNFLGSLKIWIPRRESKFSYDLTNAFNRDFIFPSGIFSVQKDFDEKYVFVPIEFLKNLMEIQGDTVSALEIKLVNPDRQVAVERKLQEQLGDKYVVKNRFEQEELFYKIVKSEKLAIILILSFMLVIASFNVIGTLSMLIIDKKDDIETLRYLGADSDLISKIFLYEGMFISLLGTILGLILGIGLVWLQQKYSLLTFPSTQTMWVMSYPVKLKTTDIVLVTAIVLFIGFVAAKLPVKYFNKRYLNG